MSPKKPCRNAAVQRAIVRAGVSHELAALEIDRRHELVLVVDSRRQVIGIGLGDPDPIPTGLVVDHGAVALGFLPHRLVIDEVVELLLLAALAVADLA
jgi:hypothetical protein